MRPYSSDLDSRLRTLERKAELLRWSVLVNVLVVAVSAFRAPSTVSGARVSELDSLRVRTLVVADSTGVVRARLGSHLPDAVIAGKRVRRGDDVAGLLLFDGTGVERGGYVTFTKSGNVALTLDSRTKQSALFAADATEGAALKLWNGDDWAELRSDTEGSRLTVGKAGAIVQQLPAMTATERAGMCRDMRTEIDAIRRPLPRADVIRACSARMPLAACRLCADAPVAAPRRTP
jgi:hypothetical protein